MRPVERGRMVQAMGQYLLDNADEIAKSLTLEQGKPLWESHHRNKVVQRVILSIMEIRLRRLKGAQFHLGSGYVRFYST